MPEGIRICGWLPTDWYDGSDRIPTEAACVGEAIDGGRDSPIARRISVISCI